MVRILAIDIGAGSGRIFSCTLSDSGLETTEEFRFRHTPITTAKKTLWNYDEILENVCMGIDAARKKYDTIASLAINSWAPDFCIFDASGQRFGDFFSYHDKRTRGVLEKIFSEISSEDIFQITGNGPLQISLLCQLIALKQSDPHVFKDGYQILPLSNALSFKLGAERSIDFTVATTSMLFDYRRADWSEEIMGAFGIHADIFPPLLPCGSAMGRMQKTNIPIINPGAHDSALAVLTAKVIAAGDLIINCGTWSIIGVAVDHPILDNQAVKAGFTNYGLPDERFFFCRVIPGLWFIQSCKKEWDACGEVHTYEELSAMAGDAKPDMPMLLDIEDPVFFTPCGIVENIRNYCRKKYGSEPRTKPQLMRCLYESIVNKYQVTAKTIETITGKRLARIHIMGGGSQDAFLCQRIANQTTADVTAGPVEATVLGNALMQLKALGVVGSEHDMQQRITESALLRKYSPE